MKQVLQSLRSGETVVADIPSPSIAPGSLLIKTSRSLVSSGTERTLVDFGKAGLISKALQQPEKVRMVLDKIKTDGFGQTLKSVFNKLDQPLPMGYCNAGVVIGVGKEVRGFAIGDRVASNGHHAEIVSVPFNLCARIPDGVQDDDAAFSVLGAIALQGIRLAAPTLGESVAVVGLGLVGLLAVQLLRANGCRVLGLDFDAGKLALAHGFGAEIVDLSAGEDPVAAAMAFSRNRGMDAVLIAASTTSSDPVHQAALMSRKRGRIVLVGVTGLELMRSDFYEKELSFQVSCSYGPGRYDPAYEAGGQDYPVGFVRWTEQRNIEAVLDMLSQRKLDPQPLVTHRFPIEQAAAAYDLISSNRSTLAVLIDYGNGNANEARTVCHDSAIIESSVRTGEPTLGFIGAGNYAGAELVPAMKATGATLKVIASSGGVSGYSASKKFGFAVNTTDVDSLFSDASLDAVVITTRHDSHAGFVLRSMASGKHAFVEKPLCLTLQELEQIESAHSGSPGCILMVGFNRRFAPQVRRIASLLSTVSEPKTILITVNAGAIPAEHWTQNRKVGGGRVIGELCHFIDLARFLSGSRIARWNRMDMQSQSRDTMSVQLAFEDGSLATINYLANGSRAFPKERVEVFAGGRILQLDNFRSLKGFGWPGFKTMNLWRQDKGQRECALQFVQSVKTGGTSPIPYDEIIEVARVTIELSES